MINRIEKKINQVSYIFIVIVLTLLVSSLFIIKWNKTIKVTGTVKTYEKISTIFTASSGKIDYIIENNSFVEEGQLLFSIMKEDYENNLNELKLLHANKTIDLRLLNEYYDFLNGGKFYPNNLYIDNHMLKVEALDINLERVQRQYDSKINMSTTYISDMEKHNAELQLRKSKNDLESYVSDETVYVKNQISRLQQELLEMANTIEELTRHIDRCSIRASISGYVTHNLNLNKGDYIYSGVELMQISPDVEHRFYVELEIPSNKVLFIQDGMSVFYNFTSIPRKRYGEAVGTILNSNVDFINGDYFYVPSTISINSFVDKYGLEYTLKDGLDCESSIIIGKEILFYIVLDKWGLL